MGPGLHAVGSKSVTTQHGFGQATFVLGPTDPSTRYVFKASYPGDSERDAASDEFIFFIRGQ